MATLGRPNLRTAEYVAKIADALDGCDESIARITEIIREAYSDNQNVWIMGNGGSLAIAQHFAQDLLKIRGVKAHAMNDPSIITAYTNDMSFEHCMEAPLSVLWEQDDPIIIFSCSGKSRNYARIVESEMRPLIAIVGTDGGFLNEKADVAVHVKSGDYQICESGFAIIADMILHQIGEP